MQQRKLGELTVSALGLGCMSMSFGYGPGDDSESERALHRALDIGYNFLDTASIYGLGHNEELIGRVLKSRRSEFVLASKCGIIVSEDGRRGVDGSPENIRKTCEDSLAKLQTDMIDLYYLHRRDFNVPIEDSVGALAELVAEGKIRHIGLSEVSSSTLRRAHKVHPITALQSEYSLWTRGPEFKVIDACRELGIGFVPFSPLGRGFFCGGIRKPEDMAEGFDMRANMPRFVGDNLRRNVELIDEFAAYAGDLGCTPGQLSLAWVLHQYDDTMVPIPGTRHVAYVEENAAATGLKLSAAELARAGDIICEARVAGERYAEDQKISLDPEE